MNHGGAWTPVFDYMLATLGLFLIMAITSRPEATPPRIETLGMIAVTAVWAAGSDDDVDLYVRDPLGRVAFFAAQDVGLMHLEYDDLGTYTSGSDSGVTVRENGERLLVRGAIPGEYVVNVHMYTKQDAAPQHVRIELWRLRGSDRRLRVREVTLDHEGDEDTAFRFTLNASGAASDYNELPRSLVAASR